MGKSEPKEGTLAVLIDADNVAAQCIEHLLAEISKLGTAGVKRVYGDWTQPQLVPWKECLLKHSIQPVQQFAYTVGKNATDMAMLIDAMDLLHAGKFKGICIVSSDSDFTPLAVRIRQEGVAAYGFGKCTTPLPFVSACDQFVFIDGLEKPSGKSKKKKATSQLVEVSPAEPATKASGFDPSGLTLLKAAIKVCADKDGRAKLSSVGTQLMKLKPDFKPKHYGFKRLSDLIKATKQVTAEVSPANKNELLLRWTG